MVLFYVLGPLEVRSGGAVRRFGVSKPGTVLATLLTQPNAWVPTGELIAASWPEKAMPVSAEANLKTYVWKLRRELPDHDGRPRIESRCGAYRLLVGRGELDTDRVEELAEQARLAAAGGDDAAAAALLEQALGLWRGQPFADVDGAVTADRLAHLDELRLGLAERLADSQLALGRAQDALFTLRTVTADAPLREGAWAQLVRVLHATGRRAEALATYRRAQELLRAELGVPPGPALAEAHRSALGGVRVGPTRRELPRDLPLTGRTAELAAIRRAARDTAPTPVVLVDGMAGVGKTALAVHAAHRLAPDYPDGQFFVRLGASGQRGTPGPAAALDRLLRGIGVPAPEIPSDVDERSALWRSELAQRRVLLVLDDVPDLDQLAPLLPGAPKCLTLVTTRNRGWHPDGAVRIRLAPLGTEAATALFRSALGRQSNGTDSVDERAVVAVVHRCGGLPAALRDAAARLHSRPHWTVRRLADELADDPCQVLSDAVRRSIVESLQRLDGRERAAWHALGDLPAEFGVAAAARALGTTQSSARQVLEALVDRGLLDVGAADEYRNHVLVRHLARCAASAGGPPRNHKRYLHASARRSGPAVIASSIIGGVS